MDDAEGMGAMSAPDPAASLRDFVAIDKSESVSDSAWAVARRGFTESAPDLLAYVERLEAALIDYAKAHDDYEGYTVGFAGSAKQRILALGCEIRERKP